MMRVWIILLLAASGLAAAESDPAETKTNAAAPAKTEHGKEDGQLAVIPNAATKPVVTTNTITIAGQKVWYRAETGMLPLLKPDGAARASVFYIAYSRLDQTDAALRPVCFCFNGGPGSSSVWLHLGALGPRRVRMNPDGTLPPPPFGLVDNEYSVLDAADLVFIDPVATGFSRPAKDEKPDQFFGQSGDVEAVADFIRLWTTRHHRWLSPKYLCGESYGVFRAAGLADYLDSRFGMYLNGLILVSGVLDFATLSDSPGNDLPYALFLPAYTSVAHFHKRLPPDLQADLPHALVEARTFIQSEYPAALQQGHALPAADRAKVVTELARLTGLPEKLIDENDLRISPTLFRKKLLLDQGLILGRYDARITGRDAASGENAPAFDPSYAATYGPFAAAMNSYLTDELNFTNDLPYEILTGVQPWRFDSRNSAPTASEHLASAMNENPYLRVLVLGGACDLACPIDGLVYSVNQLQLADQYRTNITFARYQAGHMMYVNLPDLKKMQNDLEKFLKP